MIKPDRSTLEIIAALIFAYFIFFFLPYDFYAPAPIWVMDWQLVNFFPVLLTLVVIIVGYISCKKDKKCSSKKAFLIKWNHILLSLVSLKVVHSGFFIGHESVIKCCIRISSSPAFYALFCYLSGLFFLVYAARNIMEIRRKNKKADEAQPKKQELYLLLYGTLIFLCPIAMEVISELYHS